MTIAGRVLDPDGKPAAGAVVDVVGQPRKAWVGADDVGTVFSVLGLAVADADGRFELEAPRTSSGRFHELRAMARAPEFGLGFARLNPDAERPEAEVRLLPERVVRGRLVDVSGRPAAGVAFRVSGLVRANGAVRYEGVWLGETPPEGLRAWPDRVTTDDRGQFVLAGIGRGFRVALEVRDPRYARQGLEIEAEAGADSRPVVLALEPAKIIEGRVLAADTGRPIPHAVISAATPLRNERANGIFTAKFRADAEGRFRINPLSGERYTLGAFPPPGEPYLIPQEELEWVKGAVTATHDIQLPRGVLVRGRVTDAATGRPLAGSSVEYIPMRADRDRVLSGWYAIVASGDDGAFQIAVQPGKGHLLVFGPTPDYVLDAIGSRVIYAGKPGGQRYYAHKILAYDARADAPPLELDAALRPGKTVKGRVVGPAGQAVADASLLSTLRVEAYNPSWRGDYQVPVRDGRFELHGLAPEAATRIHIFEPEHEWGASVEVSGRQADEELVVTLQPCGRATARFVGPDGRPLADFRPHFEFVATPGPTRLTRDERVLAELVADAELMANVDRKHYWDGPRTDAEGRVTFPALIPGSTYRLLDFSTVNAEGPQVRKDFTVKPDETLDLGEILIEKPPR